MDGVAGRGRYVALAVLLLPSLIGMGAFYLLPVAASLVLSFAEWDLLTPIKWIGFGNYAAILNDGTMWQALRNTILFILGYLPSVVVLGLALAVAISTSMTTTINGRYGDGTWGLRVALLVAAAVTAVGWWLAHRARVAAASPR